MSIKINLDDIFHTDKISETKDHLFIDQLDSEQPSIQLQNHRNQLRLLMRDDLFDKNSIEEVPTETNFSFQLQTILSQKEKKPGQRLYYENKMRQTRKMKQIQRIKDIQLQKERLEATGRPKINQFSKKLMERKKQDDNIKKNTKNKSENQVMSSFQKQEQQLKKCTFKPQLISKSNTTKARKEKVFEQLFQDHKVKQLKKKMQSQQSQEEEVLKRKISRQQFDAFLQRNQKFVQKMDKKHNILSSTSLCYDLTSGQKLHQPKINKPPKFLIPFSKVSKSSNHKSHKSFTEGSNMTPKNNNSIFAKNANYFEDVSPFSIETTMKKASQSIEIVEDPNQYYHDDEQHSN